MLELRELDGEFEKPKFFHYKHKLCAHSRNEQIGCSACIEVCSARAIRSDASRKGKAKGEAAGGIVVEPHLCVGCGACSTVCPSGALAFGYPGTVDQGRKLRTLLTAYRLAGGKEAALLLHSEGAGARLIGELGRAARTDKAVRGVPARVLPVALWHTASVGLDLWLAAIARRREPGVGAAHATKRRPSTAPRSPSRWRWRRPSSRGWATAASTSS